MLIDKIVKLPKRDALEVLLLKMFVRFTSKADEFKLLIFKPLTSFRTNQLSDARIVNRDNFSDFRFL